MLLRHALAVVALVCACGGERDRGVPVDGGGRSDGGAVTVDGGGDTLLAPGELDRSFGTPGANGLLRVRESGAPLRVTESFAVLPDGDVLLIGQTRLNQSGGTVRLAADGSPRAGYGAGEPDFPATAMARPDTQHEAVHILADTRVLAVGGGGYYGDLLHVARYTPMGTLDPTFADGGVLGFESGGTFVDVAPHRDGFVAAGGLGTLLRFSADGAIDASFGVDGWLDTALLPEDFEPDHVAVLDDGRIVLGGQSGLYAPTVVRLTPDGALDPSFGEGGVLVTDLGTTGLGGMCVGADGGLWLAVDSVRALEITKLTSGGSVDGSFGESGTARVSLVDWVDLHATACVADGSFVLLARTYELGEDETSDVVLARVDASGSLDTSFADAGIARLDIAAMAGEPRGEDRPVDLVIDGGLAYVLSRFGNVASDAVVVFRVGL